MVMRQLSNEEYKKRLLDVMSKIDEICRKNNLWYTIIYGTLLGAVRHNGFIPWDDDIDIAMTRKDYYAFGKYISEHPEYELNFIDVNYRKDTIYICGKVCDSKTIVKESCFRSVKDYGAFVDIFILDNIPDDENERRKFKSKARFMCKTIQHSAQLNPGKPKGFKHLILLYTSFIYSHCFNTYKLIKKLDSYCQKYNEMDTEYFGVPYFIAVFKKNDFKELIDFNFEGHCFKGPRKYDEILNSTYKNYKELPPLEERVTHMIECYWKD